MKNKAILFVVVLLALAFVLALARCDALHGDSESNAETTATPQATVAPSETPQAEATETPTETPKTEETVSPTKTSEPQTAVVSTETPDAQATAEPIETAKPSLTCAPPVETTLAMTIEGGTEEIPAYQYQKENYKITVPQEGWLEHEPDHWMATLNDQVWFEVLKLTENDAAAVAAEYLGQEAEPSVWVDAEIYYTISDDAMLTLQLVGSVDGISYYVLMQCPNEAVEGYGTRMIYIASSVVFG